MDIAIWAPRLKATAAPPPKGGAAQAEPYFAHPNDWIDLIRAEDVRLLAASHEGRHKGRPDAASFVCDVDEPVFDFGKMRTNAEG